MLKYVLTSVVDLEELWLSLTGSPSGVLFQIWLLQINISGEIHKPLKVHGKTTQVHGHSQLSDVQNTKLQLSQVVNQLTTRMHCVA